MTISGSATPGFEPLAEAFARNFEDHGERGAAIALHFRGALEVSLWAGNRDTGTGTAWTEDTLVNVYSTTKGIAGAVVALLVMVDLVHR